ncbi:MAG TPA: hypothetical protein VGJ45_07665 [Pseudonocardiaceae bacterium]
MTDNPDEEFIAVAVMLADPDTSAGDAALLAHIDQRAQELLAEPEFDAWWRGMAASVRERPFPVARIAEWLLYRNIALDRPWKPDHLLRASGWLQQRVATDLDNADALSILAEQGRAERIRALAAQRR